MRSMRHFVIIVMSIMTQEYDSFTLLDKTDFLSAQGRFTISSTGLYLAVVDKGSCTGIQRLVVYYDICPYQVKNLVIYPQTVAPSIGFSQDIDIVGSCVENASPVSANLQLTCELNGVWDNVVVSCHCNPGYELFNNISCDGK